MKQSSKTISVIGCGWMGLPFSQIMNATGWKIKGSTTRTEKVELLKSAGIEPFIVRFPETKTVDPNLYEADMLLLNVPPGRSNPEALSRYASSIRNMLIDIKKVNQIRKIIFVSSTSVYGKSGDFFDEYSVTDPETGSGKVLLEAENEVISAGIPYVILRFGGLAGPKRHPGYFFAGKENLPNGNQSVNFLHLEDAISVVKYMLEQPIENEVFNVVAPFHPDKELFYKKMTSLLDMLPPKFAKSNSTERREIVIEKLIKQTDFKFKYPDPMMFDF